MGTSPLYPKTSTFWTSTFCWMSIPPNIWVLLLFVMSHSSCLTCLKPHIGQNVSLIGFRQILPKYLPVMHIFSFTIITYLKKLLGVKFFFTKQRPAGLSPKIIPPAACVLPKMPSPLTYWMLPSVWQKHWMVKILLTFQCYLEDPGSSNACFPIPPIILFQKL